VVVTTPVKLTPPKAGPVQVADAGSLKVAQ